MPERDFAGELAALQAMLTVQRDVAVARLRTLHEAWARALLGIEESGNLVAQVRAAVERGVASKIAAEATTQLQAAERHQWEIGTWSSGSGEGLASMAEVRSLQLAQAWLWSTQTVDKARDEARRLLREAEDDPNDMAARHRKHMQALHARLEG